MSTLRQSLSYEPQILRFGTSGRRGEVVHLTQLEIYINALAELRYLQSLPRQGGGISKGDEFFYAYDLRPTSTRFASEQANRGELAQAIEQAIRDAGMTPVNLGCIPTPALMSYALGLGKGSMMITGSHIPFDRNGYKTNSAKGELLKTDEGPINSYVEDVRKQLYEQPASDSLFDSTGSLKGGSRPLSAKQVDAAEAYIRRYTDFFAGASLKGMRLLAYQHSSVGRDLLVEVFKRLGAEVFPAGRSETFVPIDTEAIDDQQLAFMQKLVDEASAKHGKLDAVISTDGDSDRPLILGVDNEVSPPRVHFFGGDLVGMVVAEYLGADAVVVPISCNDAIDRGPLQKLLEPKTRIGSPYVIAGMDIARAKGRQRVCGWEANGGFLLGSDFSRDGNVLTALPTRDAILPIAGVLFAAAQQQLSISQIFARLPRRFSKAALLRQFPRPTSQKIIKRFTPDDGLIADVFFSGEDVRAVDAQGIDIRIHPDAQQTSRKIRDDVAGFFPRSAFGEVTHINYIDGVRIYFSSGDVAHVRPSGNADELRVYAVADSQSRAEEIAALGIAEPDGILRKMEKVVS